MIANVSSISVTTLLLIVAYNVKREGDDINETDEFFFIITMTTCKALGYSLYCVSISMFCWMSVMCFDLFWTFARTTLPRYGNDVISSHYFFPSSCLLGMGERSKRAGTISSQNKKHRCKHKKIYSPQAGKGKEREQQNTPQGLL